jgi:MYXO-CTERM domain-containing protein
VIRPTSTLVVILPLLALASATVAAAPLVSTDHDTGRVTVRGAPTHPIDAGVPWALAIDDALSKPLVEQWYGREVAEAWRDIEPQWRGTMLFTRDSFHEDMLAALGVPPLPAFNYEPSPGVVYVAMDGVTIRPSCGNGETANAALNCSPLVNAETTFAAFGGNAAAEFQQLRSYYEPFDLNMTSVRPPDWMPYTMTVIGGSAAQIGAAGACGIANVACDGLKRNHVSLNFPQSCGGMAETAAQETSHNWGLEHTDNPQDLLYPFNNAGFKTFVNDCMTISHATGSGVTQCGYIHEVYCPAGDGEEQNSYAELMGVFGPRTPDTTPPQIVSVSPANGAVLGNANDILVTAHITEDSRMVAVNWQWIEGLPEGLESYRRCTNNVCNQDFNPGVSFVAADMPWDFVVLSGAPAGTYTFKVEALDAYGNYDSETITIEVVEGSGEPGGGLDESGGGSEGEGGGSSEGGGTTGAGETGDGTGGGGGLDGGSSSGGCRMGTPAASWGLGLVGLLALGRRRRRLA